MKTPICPVSFIPEECLTNKNEAVWLANVETLETLVLENVSKRPYHEFLLSVTGSLEVRSKVYPWVLCHTHVHPHSLSSFSPQDCKQIENLPLLGHFMYHTVTGQYQFRLSEFLETERSYIGREWDWALRNCYTLVRDWYKREKGIYLPPRYLECEKFYQVDPNWDMYQENLPEYGFETVNPWDYSHGDLVLMTLGRTHNPNHIGILIKEEGEPLKVLHHIGGRPSCIEVYSELLRNLTVSVWHYAK